MQMQRLLLPCNSEGLAWIAQQEVEQLRLVPGISAAVVHEAVSGGLFAVAHLILMAEEHAECQAFIQHCSVASKPANFVRHFQKLQHQQQCWEEQHGSSESWSLPDDLEARISFTGQIMTKAAREDKFAAVAWLQAICICDLYEDDTRPMEAAARRGSLEMLRLLRSGPCPAPWGSKVIRAAAQHPACLQWLLTQDPPVPAIPLMQTKWFAMDTWMLLSALAGSSTFRRLPQVAIGWRSLPSVAICTSCSGCMIASCPFR